MEFSFAADDNEDSDAGQDCDSFLNSDVLKVLAKLEEQRKEEEEIAKLLEKMKKGLQEDDGEGEGVCKERKKWSHFIIPLEGMNKHKKIGISCF
jgi:hypothetical protein